MNSKLRHLLVVVLSLSNLLYPTTTANTAPNPIEIISVSEVSSTSVEILFDSSISKKSLSYYVINAVVTSSVGMPKNIKKTIKTKASGLITAEIKNLNPKASYKFTVSAKTNKAKMISSVAVAYSPISDLMDLLSNLPADWGNPKPIQLPAPAPTTAPVVLPAFTLTASTETRTVNTAATGFTINSTGSTITSFAINTTPPGMSFNTTTGALTGTPNTVAAATNYTITASNATGSATQIFRLTVTAVVYTVGQAGPGGGIIFYVASTPFACGPTRAATCTYLEAAPSGWNTGIDPQRSWANTTYQSTTVNNSTSPETATATAIGWGYRNTRAIILQGNTATDTSAAALADSYTVTVSGVVYDDWFLPSQDELNELYLQRTTVGGFVNDEYWSSSENGANSARFQNFSTGNISATNKAFAGDYVRPIRAL